MASSLPPRPGSLPPPKVPPRVAAQTRIHSLELELAAEPEKRRRAVLEYEIGALLEHRLEEGDEAARRYLSAYNLEPSFRPPLLALGRMFRARRSFRNVDRILKSALRGASPPGIRASLLTQRGLVLHDQLDDATTAEELWSEAARVDPTDRTALLLLEHRQRASGQLEAAERTLEQRCERTADPSLRAALLRELAGRRLEQGAVDAAIDLLRAALLLGVDTRRSLEALAELGRAHGRTAVLLEALDALAAELQRDPQLAALTETAATAAALHREAGAARLAADDAGAAALSFAAAAALQPDDVFLRLEQLDALDRAGQHDEVISQARALLERTSDARHQALLWFRMAEAEQARGDSDAVRQCLREALRFDPEAATALAVYEDACLDAGAIDELAASLAARATICSGEASARLLWRAAELRLSLLGQAHGAFEAYAAAAAAASDPVPVWRSLHGLSAVRGEHVLAVAAADRLLTLDIDPDERSALTLDRYRRTARHLKDTAAATAILTAALEDPSCGDWAPDCARVHAASTGDDARLAQAHRQLAANADDDATTAAHHCAAARALRRAGDLSGACDALRDALRSAPANAYAVALLEEILLQQGEAGEAVRLLREAAEMEHNARKSELSLLHAGAAAEAAGDLALATQSYEAAIDRDPEALSPLWAMRRAAERGRDSDARLLALEGLARRAAPADESALAWLELGEAYDHGQSFTLAVHALERAMAQRSTAESAALGLALCPDVTLLDEPRDAALARLSRNDDALGALCAYERLAAATLLDRTRAAALLTQSRWEASVSRWSSVVPLLAADGALARSDALHALGTLCEGSEASAELKLHAIRTRRYAGGSAAADDALVQALELAESAPGSLATAVALDEALGVNDEPEARSGALARRLLDLRPELRGGLEAAYARTLLAAGLGAEATAAARLAIQGDPNDLAAWELLRVSGRATGDWNAVVDAANKLASRLDGANAGTLLEEAADVLLERLDQPREAEEQLRHALAADPARPSAFAKLHDLYLRRRHWKGLLLLLQQRLDHVRDAHERVELLREQATVLHCTGAREAALVALDELLALAPEHPAGLRSLVDVHAALRQWPQAVEGLRRLARVCADSERAAVVEQAGDLLERELGDATGAFQTLSSLVGTPLDTPAFQERLGALAVRAEAWRDAAQCLSSAAARRHGQDRADLERRVGEILAGQLGDTEAAQAAYRRALAAVPTDLASAARLRRLLKEPADRTTLEAEVIAALRDALRAEPANAELWRKLQRAADWCGQRTAQRLALSALCALGAADVTEQRARDAMQPPLRALRPGPLSSALATALTAGLDPAQHALGTAVSAALSSLQPRTPADYGAHRRDRLGRFAESAVRDELTAIVGTLGGEIQEFYSGGHPPNSVGMVQGSGRDQVWVAERTLTVPLGTTLRFRVAFAAQAATLEAADLASLPLGVARRAIFALALTAGRPLPGGPDATSLTDVIVGYERGLSRAGRRAIGTAIERLASDTSIDGYLETLQLCCVKAAVLFSERLETGLATLLGEDHTPQAIVASKVALDLLRFWASAELAEVCVQMESRA